METGVRHEIRDQETREIQRRLSERFDVEVDGGPSRSSD